jgi:hypothetical protein
MPPSPSFSYSCYAPFHSLSLNPLLLLLVTSPQDGQHHATTPRVAGGHAGLAFQEKGGRAKVTLDVYT